MSSPSRESADVGGTRRGTMLVVLAVLAVLALNGFVSWGYLGLYWGDSGRWLYEVEQYAHGARVYQDVYWGSPPLGMWLVGGMARLIGTDLVQVWSIASTIAALVAVAYALTVVQLLPLRLALPVAVTGMTLGAVYASNFSAPLVSGMYTPAFPVAVMFAFAQLALFLREWKRPSLAGSALVGALGGAGVISKHDVWIACVLLTAVTALIAPSDGHSRTARVVATTAGFVAVVGGTLAVLTAFHGVDALVPIFTGHRLLQETAGTNLPNLAQAVVDLAALGLAIAVCCSLAWVTGVWRSRTALTLIVGGAALAGIAICFWLLKAEWLARHVLANGRSEFAPPFERMLSPVASDLGTRLQRAFTAIRVELIRHLIPFGVPLAVLALAFARRTRAVSALQWRLLVVLLLFALVLRGRRLTSDTEWSVLMLEVPVYVFALATLWRLPVRLVTRAVALGCVVLLAGAMIAHRRFGFGVGTRRGTFPVIQTARGRARIGPGLAADYSYVRDLALMADPSGERPLLAFGYSAGHNYLVGRPGVASLTHGFLFSLYPTPDSAYRVARAQHDRLILVDNPAYSDAIPAPAFTPWRWQPRMVQNPYLQHDRRLFEMLLQVCRKVIAPNRHSGLSVYDCAAADSAGLAR